MRKHMTPLFIGLAALVLATTATAQSRNLITIVFNGEETGLTRAALQDIGVTTIVTNTDYTDGPTRFTGPLARDVLRAVGVDMTGSASFVAANDYSAEIPLSDLVAYDVVLALEVDGRRLSLRDKGPIWVMYPIDDHQELSDPIYNNRLIWQLVRIEVP